MERGFNKQLKQSSMINNVPMNTRIQEMAFTVDQIGGKSLKCILIKFELSTSSGFEDITVQNQ